MRQQNFNSQNRRVHGRGKERTLMAAGGAGHRQQVPNQPERYYGKVLFYQPEKKFGFIQPDQKEIEYNGLIHEFHALGGIYVSSKNIVQMGPGVSRLRKYGRVAFEIKDLNRRGKIEAYAVTEENGRPFEPINPTDGYTEDCWSILLGVLWDKVPMFIGHKGKVITEISMKYEVSLTVLNKTDRNVVEFQRNYFAVVEVVGSDKKKLVECAQHIAKMMTESQNGYMEDPTEKTHILAFIPSKKVGKVVGVGGAHIKKMENRESGEGERVRAHLERFEKEISICRRNVEDETHAVVQCLYLIGPEPGVNRAIKLFVQAAAIPVHPKLGFRQRRGSSKKTSNEDSDNKDSDNKASEEEPEQLKPRVLDPEGSEVPEEDPEEDPEKAEEEPEKAEEIEEQGEKEEETPKDEENEETEVKGVVSPVSVLNDFSVPVDNAEEKPIVT